MKLIDRIDIKPVEKSSVTPWLQRILWLALAFALSVSSVAGVGCPFGISLITVSGRKNFAFATLGAALGYIFFSPHTEAVRYFSAVLICTLATAAILFFSQTGESYLRMLVAGLSVLSTGIVMAYKTQSPAAEYALVAGESILAAGGSFFFGRAVNSGFSRIGLRALPTVDLTCLIVSGATLLAGLSAFEILGFSPARVAAVLIILAAVRFGSQRQALIISLCLGFSLGISRENGLFLIGAYAFSALAAGLFSGLSSAATGVSFTLTMSFFAVAASLGRLSVACVLESAAASVVLALLPAGVTAKLSELFESSADINPDGSLRQSLVVRLRFASSALAQVSESVREVRDRINMLGVTEPFEKEIRMVAADQFFSISDMLEDLAFEFDEAESFDFRTAGKIRRMLGGYGIYPENISVISDRFGRTRVEILVSKNAKGLSNPRLTAEISKLCKRDFERPKVSTSKAGVLLTMTEKPNYKMNVGFAQFSAQGELCGDTVKTVTDTKGHTVLIISDGMGRGGRAALDGAMGAGLLSKLLCAGFGFDSALKVVNSALLVKSSDESLATLDCTSVDLFSGKCEFYKAGAPRSYILKQDRLTKCELSSMPAGILRGIEFAKRTTVLNSNDEIIMMSDGVTDTSEEELEDFIIRTRAFEPNDKAQAILEFALGRADARHRDDMSVIVARLLDR